MSSISLKANSVMLINLPKSKIERFIFLRFIFFFFSNVLVNALGLVIQTQMHLQLDMTSVSKAC
jgi:uncharacterized membrane protein YcgQ (UPF0703/DUF1980 family)